MHVVESGGWLLCRKTTLDFVKPAASEEMPTETCRLDVRQRLVRVQLCLGMPGRRSSWGPRWKAADIAVVLGMAGMALHCNSVVPGSVAVLSTMLRLPHEWSYD